MIVKELLSSNYIETVILENSRNHVGIGILAQINPPKRTINERQ